MIQISVVSSVSLCICILYDLGTTLAVTGPGSVRWRRGRVGVDIDHGVGNVKHWVVVVTLTMMVTLRRGRSKGMLARPLRHVAGLVLFTHLGSQSWRKKSNWLLKSRPSKFTWMTIYKSFWQQKNKDAIISNKSGLPPKRLSLKWSFTNSSDRKAHLKITFSKNQWE